MSLSNRIKKVIWVTLLGCTLEGYDFAIYGGLAETLGKLFFPASTKLLSLLAGYLVFATGFIMRPIGGFFFGYIGDTYGRKASLFLSIIIMAISTTAIGLLPTYRTIGILAPVFLSIARLLQGASFGGQFSGSITFLVEFSPVEKRGVIGSVSFIGLVAGMLLGMVVSLLVESSTTTAVFETWGWRVPFLFGILIALVGIYLRLYLHESPIYLKARRRQQLSRKPLRELFSKHTPTLLLAMTLYFAVTVPFYTVTIFTKTYMSTTLGYSSFFSDGVNILSLCLLMITIPVSGWISDKYGRKPLLRIGVIGLIAFCYLIFWMLNTGLPIYALLSQILFSILLGIYMGPIPALLTELFNTQIRYSGVALSYNLSAAFFGGTTPFVATWISSRLGYEWIAAYIIAFCFISLIALRWYQESYRKELSQ